jgi:hypothetical protein
LPRCRSATMLAKSCLSPVTFSLLTSLFGILCHRRHFDVKGWGVQTIALFNPLQVILVLQFCTCGCLRYLFILDRYTWYSVDWRSILGRAGLLFSTSFRSSLIQWVYWTQNICKPGLRHSNRGREDGKGKGVARRLMRYRFPSLPVPRQAGLQRMYLQRSAKLGNIWWRVTLLGW